eukprot:10537082-Karenia_brevis.AAC.1
MSEVVAGALQRQCLKVAERVGDVHVAKADRDHPHIMTTYHMGTRQAVSGRLCLVGFRRTETPR